MITSIEQARAVQARRVKLRRPLKRRVWFPPQDEESPGRWETVAANIGVAKAVRRFLKRHGMKAAQL